MEKFGFSGLWSHVGSSVLSAALLVGDPLLSYLQVIALPAWAHTVVVGAAALFALYKGSAKPSVAAVP